MRLWKLTAISLVALGLLSTNLHRWQANTLAGIASLSIDEAVVSQDPQLAASAGNLLIRAQALWPMPEIPNLQATVLMLLGRPKEAIPIYEAVMVDNPSPEVLTNLGVAYMQSGDIESAQVLLELSALYNHNLSKTYQARLLMAQNFGTKLPEY